MYSLLEQIIYNTEQVFSWQRFYARIEHYNYQYIMNKLIKQRDLQWWALECHPSTCG